MLFSVQVDTDLPPTLNRKYRQKERLTLSSYTLPRAHTPVHIARIRKIFHTFLPIFLHI